MRRDRLVRYQLSLQHPSLNDDALWRIETTGVLEQRFGLDQKTARSQVNSDTKCSKAVISTCEANNDGCIERL